MFPAFGTLNHFDVLCVLGCPFAFLGFAFALRLFERWLKVFLGSTTFIVAIWGLTVLLCRFSGVSWAFGDFGRGIDWFGCVRASVSILYFRASFAGFGHYFASSVLF